MGRVEKEEAASRLMERICSFIQPLLSSHLSEITVTKKSRLTVVHLGTGSRVEKRRSDGSLPVAMGGAFATPPQSGLA